MCACGFILLYITQAWKAALSFSSLSNVAPSLYIAHKYKSQVNLFGTHFFPVPFSRVRSCLCINMFSVNVQ